MVQPKNSDKGKIMNSKNLDLSKSKIQIQNGRLKKKLNFSTSPKAEQFAPKFHWLVLGLVRIDWCEGHWFCSSHMSVRLADVSLKTGKINPTNPRTHPWNFGWNCSAFGRVEKLIFFESAILNFFLQKKKKNLPHPHEN